MSPPADEQHAPTDAGSDAADAHAPSRAASGDHGDGDLHAHEPLGPIDWQAWAMAAAGGVLAVVVAITLVLAAHP